MALSEGQSGRGSDNSPRSRLEVTRSFARDVLVNVLANLVAAAMIYLAGAAAGVFPRVAALIGPSVIVILMALAALFFVISKVTRRVEFILLSGVFLGLGGLLASLSMKPNDDGWEQPIHYQVFYVLWITWCIATWLVFRWTRIIEPHGGSDHTP